MGFFAVNVWILGDVLLSTWDLWYPNIKYHQWKCYKRKLSNIDKILNTDSLFQLNGRVGYSRSDFQQLRSIKRMHNRSFGLRLKEMRASTLDSCHWPKRSTIKSDACTYNNLILFCIPWGAGLITAPMIIPGVNVLSRSITSVSLDVA